MIKQQNLIKRVRKYTIDEVEDREKYERILNDPKLIITRTEFAYDKLGRAVVTIWYDEED